jgi:hypothetical protein
MRHLSKAEDDLVKKLGECLTDYGSLPSGGIAEAHKFEQAIKVAQRNVLGRAKRGVRR